MTEKSNSSTKSEMMAIANAGGMGDVTNAQGKKHSPGDGVYLPWSDDKMIIQAHKYVNRVDILNAVNTARRTRFSVNALFISISFMFDHNSYVVNQTTRFPGPGQYINIYSPVISRLISGILNACDVALYSMENFQCNNQSQKRYEIMAESKEEYIECLKRLEMECDVIKEIYTRSSFEEKYGLTWTEHANESH